MEIDSEKLVYLDNNQDIGKVLCDLKFFKKQKKYHNLTIHILDVLSKALLKSSKNNYKNFDVYINCKNVKVKNFDLKFFRYLSNILKKLFPDKVRLLYFVNTTKNLSVILKIVKVFAAPEFRKKMKFIKEELPIFNANNHPPKNVIDECLVENPLLIG